MAKKKAAPVKRTKARDDFHGGYTKTLNSSTTGITSGWYQPPTHRDANDTLLDEIASWKRADDLGEPQTREQTRELLDDVHTFVEAAKGELESLQEEIDDLKKTETGDERRLSDENRKLLNDALAFAKGSWTGQMKQAQALKRPVDADLIDKVDRIELLITILGENSPITYHVIDDSEA